MITALKALVFDKYKCCNLGPISNYLGICICRNCPNCTVELSLESYIDQLTKDYNCSYLTCHNPMNVKALKLKLQHSNDVCKNRALAVTNLSLGACSTQPCSCALTLHFMLVIWLV
jgi:hypothetical protein